MPLRYSAKSDYEIARLKLPRPMHCKVCA
jgi:hypothetical protein